MSVVHVVVPEGIDDPERPSGGNLYDRRICHGLESIGWSVHEHAVSGGWPRSSEVSLAALDQIVRRIPDDAVVLLDGLIASTAPAVLVPQARRLRLVVLVHMPLGHRPPDRAGDEVRDRERAVLSVAAVVVTTSHWSRRRLLELYRLPADHLRVAEPGVDAGKLATATAAGGALLCVAAVTFDKGHDVLIDALATLTERSWHCLCVGNLNRDPAFVEGLRRRLHGGCLADRVSFTGARTGAELARRYADADLLVLPSRAETYGMVIPEALTRGLPVIAAQVGGVTEALGYGAEGIRPGVLVPPDDPAALAGALRAWLEDANLRARLRRAAGERRASLRAWTTTTSVIADVLAGAT